MELSKIITVSKPVCRWSDPADPHNLCRRYDPPLSICFSCKGQHLEDKSYYYFCATCDLEFHRSCHLVPREIKHPFHLIHPLTLTSILAKSDPDSEIDDLIPIGWSDSSSDSPSGSSSDSDDSVSPLEYDISEFDHMVKCNFCRKNLQQKEDDDIQYYHCSTCNFSIHYQCALIRPPLTIENHKSHDHTLTLFPRKIPLPCDACGFSLDAAHLIDHVYSCLLCNYMVHRLCIDLPRVIKITRHPHRLSYTSSIVPARELSCGLCRKTVDVNYGSYTCNKGCHYALHSKCATKKKVWDGKDLEGVPEEEEEEILDPFLRIDEETIQHFSHDHHHLKLRQSHENKFCEACTLPMTVSDRFYSCTECEFVLHETCASLPRKLYHPVHKHPLTLFHPFSSSNPHKVKRKYYRDGLFECNGCARHCCGFMYRCSEKGCGFQLDARCASLPDPLIHNCHPRDHPLFFNFTKGECIGFVSRACGDSEYLECIKCDDSFLCLYCATLPCVAHYKHDKHPLTLCYGKEETSDLKHYWCEICEGKLDATKWFYTCDSCCVTLHVICLLGKDVYYLKPNHIIKIDGINVEIEYNSGNTRPVCKKCRLRCIYTLVFKSENEIFCSLTCLNFMEKKIIFRRQQRLLKCIGSRFR